MPDLSSDDPDYVLETDTSSSPSDESPMVYWKTQGISQLKNRQSLHPQMIKMSR
ncbi:hypothetical protein DPMN_023416 [Dreissena polymorpha]|uniref:Uncharacterized protein n=1 Tax=Dreissena polymorpha TaxID=45954 RepID=A0A9D4LM29_DREPO|nr:hypothetical protein DPMN_023416 [Dreissena polymorpha]